MSNIDWNTFEADTGQKWIDGKAIFQKTIETGQLPDGPVLDVKSVAHGISGIDALIDVYGSAGPLPGFGVLIGLPQWDNSAVGNVDIFLDATDVVIACSQDVSAFTVSQVTALYTKT